MKVRTRIKMSKVILELSTNGSNLRERRVIVDVRVGI